MKPHPLSEIFPAMEGAEFSALVEDIRAHGQVQPLVMYQGKILDGRNRSRACDRLGIKPKTTNYRGTDPLGYVLSLNLSRRHLNESQRAMVAAKIATLGHGGSRGQDANLHLEKTTKSAAKAVNVSERSAASARKVVEHATPALKKSVERGDIPVSTAAKLADAPAKTQKAAADGGKEVAREIVKKIEALAAPDPPKDPPVKTFGLQIPPQILVRIEKEQGLIDKIGKLLAEAKRTYTDLESLRGIERFEGNKHIGSSFRAAINELNALKLTRPHSVCPYCKLVPEVMKACASCRTHGYVSEMGLKDVHPVYLQEGDLAIVAAGGKEVPLSHFSTEDF